MRPVQLPFKKPRPPRPLSRSAQPQRIIQYTHTSQEADYDNDLPLHRLSSSQSVLNVVDRFGNTLLWNSEAGTSLITLPIWIYEHVEDLTNSFLV